MSTVERFTDADRRRVDTMLEKALKSRVQTVQIMPDGVELIEVESGDLLKKFVVYEVLDPPCPDRPECQTCDAASEDDVCLPDEIPSRRSPQQLHGRPRAGPPRKGPAVRGVLVTVSLQEQKGRAS